MSRKFLVTTALEEFWDPSVPLLFVDESCRRYSRRQFWEPLGGEVLLLQWRREHRCRRVLPEVVRLCERLVEALGQGLNRLHGTRFDHRYWRILLYPWAYPHVSALFDHLWSATEALQYAPDLTTLVLKKGDFVAPRDCLEHFEYLATDLYNLQLYTRVFSALGYDFPDRRTSHRIPDSIQPTFLSGRVRRLARFVDVTAGMLRVFPRDVYLLSPYWGLSGLLRLILNSRGRIWTFVREPLNLPRKPVDIDARTGLADPLTGQTAIERVINAAAPWEIPQCFVESYSELVAAAALSGRPAPRAIVSANGWYYHEIFKEWAARAATHGTLLAGVQHGGQYGMLACRGSEEMHEMAFADRYYSWGWDRPSPRAEVVPMPAPNLMGQVEVPASNHLTGILFGATAQPRFVNCICNTVDKMIEYIEWQMRFLDALPRSLQEGLRSRLHRSDAGWDIAHRWYDRAPKVAIETWDRPFIDSLADCRLYVCDHCSTTMLQALAANRPTVLFWDPAQNSPSAEAYNDFDELARAGILFYSPEDAAHAVRFVYPDVESWWNQPKLQAVRVRFCARFARTSPTAILDWKRELLSFAHQPCGDASTAALRQTPTKKTIV